MKRPLLFLALLFPVPVQAAWVSVGSFVSTSTKTGSDPFISTTTAALEAGNVGICAVAIDNDGTGTDTDDFAGTNTDAAGNTWSVIGENEVDPGSANAGAAVELTYTLATNTLAAGATIGFQLANSKNSKAAECWEFTVYSGATITVMGTEQKEDAAGADAGALTIGSLSDSEHLWFRGIASETGTTETITETTSWTKAENGTTGSTDNTNMRVYIEFIIATATTQTSDPAFSGTFDRASSMRALDETGGTPPAGGSRRVISIQ